MKRRLFLAALLAVLPSVASAASAPGDPGCLPRASDGGAEPSAEAKRAAGIKVAGEMMGRTIQAQAMPGAQAVTPELGPMSLDIAFGGL